MSQNPNHLQHWGHCLILQAVNVDALSWRWRGRYCDHDTNVPFLLLAEGAPISHGTDHACSQQTPLCCKWATCMPFLTVRLSPPAQPSLPACTVGGRIDPNPEWVGAGMLTDTSGFIEDIFCKHLWVDNGQK